MKTDGVQEKPAAAPTSAPKENEPKEGATSGKSFREAMERTGEEGGGSGGETAGRDDGGGRGGERFPLQRGLDPLRAARDLVDKAGAEGEPLPTFQIPPSILHPPAPVVQPPSERMAVSALAQAIAERLVQSARLEASPSGRLDFVLEMKPERLGAMEIRVRMEDGQIHAVFQVQQPEVRATLEAQSGTLRQALQDRGLSVGQIEIGAPRERPRGEREGQGEPHDGETPDRRGGRR